jgi:hypothetical protein
MFGIDIVNQIIGLAVGAGAGLVGGFILRPIIKRAVRGIFTKLRGSLVEELKKNPKYKGILLECILFAQKELAGAAGLERKNLAVKRARLLLPDGFLEEVVVTAIEEIYSEALLPIEGAK